MNTLSWVQSWYAKQCDGDWEHSGGIEIHTLDNPGWRVRIRIDDTELEARPFARREEERSDNDWIRCWVESDFFEGACGPENLLEVLRIFREWAEAS